ncbi:MAG: basic amino acid ABC transporter substrate-binding protein [Mogibacterium sp.]|nr:basic amino acid ABC transporter substrate-binding protein [Mogibacterium sp.]
MKKLTKAMALLLIALLAVGMLAACGGGGDSGDSGEEEVVVYIAGTEPTYPPFDSTTEDGEIIGFDMDLLNAIAEDQGFEVKYQAFEFDALIPATQAGNCDIIAAAMNIMPDRAEVVDFSDPYFESGKVILVKADNDTIKSDSDLTPDMKVAAQIGTTEGEYVQQLAADGKIKEAVVLNQTTACILQLQNGDVDAVVIDAPVAMYYDLQNEDIKQIDSVIDPAQMAFAVNKGNDELLAKINAGLAHVKENGTYDALVEKWFTNGGEE